MKKWPSVILETRTNVLSESRHTSCFCDGFFSVVKGPRKEGSLITKFSMRKANTCTPIQAADDPLALWFLPHLLHSIHE